MPRGKARAPPLQRRKEVATTFLISTVIIAVVYQSRAGRSEGLGDGRKEKGHAWDGTGLDVRGSRWGIESVKKNDQEEGLFFPKPPKSGRRGALKNKWSQRLEGGGYRKEEKTSEMMNDGRREEREKISLFGCLDRMWTEWEGEGARSDDDDPRWFFSSVENACTTVSREIKKDTSSSPSSLTIRRRHLLWERKIFRQGRQGLMIQNSALYTHS